MPTPEAAVGIRFNLTGMDEVITQIGALQTALGSLGIIPANPFNAALTHHQAEQGTTAQDVQLPLPFNGPQMVPTPSQQGGLSSQPGSGFVIQQAAIVIQTATITVQTGTVNVAGGAGGGGAQVSPGPGPGPGPAPPPDNSTPPSPPDANAAPHVPSVTRPHEQVVKPSHAAGLNRYMEEMRSGATSLDFQSWQQDQLGLFGQQGGRGSFATFLNTGRGDVGFMQQAAGRVLRGLPGLEGAGEAMLAGEGAGAAMGALGPAAGAAAALYAAHLATQIGVAGLQPAISMRATSPEEQVASMMGPLAGIPILGTPFQMTQQRIEALGNIRDQAAVMGARYNVDPKRIEELASESGRGFGAQAFDWLSTIPLGVLPNPIGLVRTLMGDDPNLGIARDIQGRAGRGIPGMSGQDVAASFAEVLAANPDMSADDVEALMRRTSRAGARPEVNRARVRGAAGLLRRMEQDPELALRAVEGAQPTEEDVLGLAGEDMAAGRVGELRRTLEDAKLAGTAPPEDVQREMLRSTGAMGMTLLRTRTQRARVQHARGAVTRARATLGDVVGAIGGELGPLQGLRAQAQARVDLLRQRMILNNDESARAELQEAENDLQELDTQIASNPFEQEQQRTAEAMTMAGTFTQRGQTELTELRRFGVQPGARMEGAFGNIRRGMDAQIAAQAEHVRFLQRSKGVRPEEIAKAEADLEDMRSRRRQEPLTEIETRMQARTELGAAIEQQGAAPLALERETHFAGTESHRLHTTVREGLQMQLDAVNTALREALKTPGIDRGVVERFNAEKARLTTAIASDVVRQAAEDAQDAIQVAGHAGRMAAPGIAAASALGVAPTAAQESQERQSVADLARVTQEQANLVRARNPRLAMQLDEEAERYRQQGRALPAQQIQREFAPALQVAAAASSIAGSELTLARQEGRGGAETLEIQRAQVTAAEHTLNLEKAELERLKGSGLPANSAILAQQQARVEQARVGVGQARTGLAQVNMPEELQERVAQTDFARRILEHTPGAAGNVPALIRSQMSNVGEEIGHLEDRLRTAGPEMTPEGRMDLRNRIRGLREQQFGLFNEMSEGWENRIMSQAINAPHSFGMIANVLGSPLRAVSHGIVNPHFGSTREHLGDFMRFAGIISQPARGLGQLGPDFADEPHVPGMGNLHGGRLFTGSARGSPASVPGAVPAGRGSPRGAEGPGAPPVIVVQLQWPNGTQAGTFSVPIPSGSVSQGVQGGEVGELINSLPIGGPAHR